MVCILFKNPTIALKLSGPAKSTKLLNKWKSKKIAIREYGQESVASSSSTSPNSTEESNKSEDVKNKEYDEDDIPF